MQGDCRTARSEVIDCVPQPNTWHAAWELFLNLS